MPKPSFDFDKEYEKLKSSYAEQIPVEDAPEASGPTETQFANEQDFNKYMEAQGGSRYLDPTIVGETLRAKLFGK